MKSYWKIFVTSSIVPGITAIIVGMVLFYLQTPKPQLVYSLQDIPPFEDTSENISIYHIAIENNGNSIVEDVFFHLHLESASIEKHSIKVDPTLKTTNHVINKNSYHIEFLNLNPTDEVIISILASSSEQPPPRPKISLRGKGVTGFEKTKEKYRSISTALISTYAGLLAGFFALLLFARTIKNNLTKKLDIGSMRSTYTKLICEETFRKANWAELDQILKDSYGKLSLLTFRGSVEPHVIDTIAQKKWFTREENSQGFGELMMNCAEKDWDKFKIKFHDSWDEKRFIEIEIDSRRRNLKLCAQLDNIEKLTDIVEKIKGVFTFTKD